MKRLLKDKRGMTLMEIVVALALLMIVIVGTTPVMLSAYDGLYKAGEKTQEMYEAKSEVEEILATGNSNETLKSPMHINIQGIGNNFSALAEVAVINAKRAVSSLETSLEAIFTNGKAHVAIVSAKVVNDDKLTQQVILQTTNLDFKFGNNPKATDLISTNKIEKFPATNSSGQPVKIDISATLPDKTVPDTSVLSNVYNHESTPATVTIESANAATGRIILNISGMDFTTSPVKIEVSYKDENDVPRTTHCYLTIKTPTIMLAGETNGADYYTSAGLETKTDKNGNRYNEFVVDGRQMRIYTVAEYVADTYTHTEDSATINYKTGIKDVTQNGVVFKSVTWISDDDHTAAIEPYYVLTGSNGAMYRTYSFTGSNPTLRTKVLGNSDGTSKENYVELDDRQATVAYPAVWGGDDAYQFGYSTYDKAMGYAQGDWCWYTEGQNDDKNKIEDPMGYSDPRAETYGSNARYQYYYNGWGGTYSYATQRSRKISYILTEKGLSLRIGGYMADEDSFGENYNRIWEKPASSYGTNHTSEFNWDIMKYWHTYKYAHNMYVTKDNKDKDEFNVYSVVYAIDGADFSNSQKSPLYYGDFGETDGHAFQDTHFANIRLKYLSTVSKDFIFNRSNDRRFREDTALSSVVLLNHATEPQAKVTVTDAVYIPYVSGSDSTTGKMFYIGTVDAYAYLSQVDNLTDAETGKSSWVDTYKFKDSDNHGYKSVYYVANEANGSGTTVYKYSLPRGQVDYVSKDDYTKKPDSVAFGQIKANYTKSATVTANSNSPESKDFYIGRSANTTKIYLFNDLAFTMGYTSNRDMVYAQITYGWVKDSSGNLVRKEEYKGCESFYFQSRYGTTSHQPRFYMTDTVVSDCGKTTNVTTPFLNSEDNNYYNVWFPGEMYNLTKVATKDNVTVAVGYAVAGTTYQFVSPDNAVNTSTGLGNIQNDGVLACMIGGKDTSFKNLLYFRDNTNFDKTSLTSSTDSDLDYSKYQTAYGSKTDYGSHQRNSVQFTAVDISAEFIKISGTKEKTEYYAYYADNHGRLFKSLVATNEVSTNSDYNPDENAGAVATVRPTMVQWISDQTYNEAPASSTGITVNKPTDTAALGDEIGYLTEIKVNDNSVGNYFSKITSIKCEGDFIIVSGHPNTEKVSSYYIVVGHTTQSEDGKTNSTEWKAFEIKKGSTSGGLGSTSGGLGSTSGGLGSTSGSSGSTSTKTPIGTSNKTECSVVVGGILYLAGSFDTAQNGKSGWVYALPLEDIRKAFPTSFKNVDGSTTSATPVLYSNYSATNYYLVTDKIYAMDGHS